MSTDKTTIPWLRWTLLIVAMFAAPALADAAVGWWAGSLVAGPAGFIAVRFA